MRSHLMYKLYFTKGELTLIDELLEDSYSDDLKREDFLHLLYIIQRGIEKQDNYIELPSSIRNNFGTYGPREHRNYKFPQLVDICEKKNILFSTGYSNFPGKESCKAYGYTKDFLSKIIDKEIEFQFCEISERTYQQLNKSFSIPTDPILLQHYNTICKLDIDLYKAEEYAKRNSGERFLRTVREILTIKYKDRIHVVDDPKTGRIFTTFNGMKKELREFCLYEGEQLDSLDLKSSQPYFLASILLQENPNNYDVQQFYNLVTNGDIYDWILEKLEINDEYFLNHADARTFAKKLFFKYLYKENRGHSTVGVLMHEYWKEIYDLIMQKKRTEEVWLTLQKLEASIFIPVCNQFISRGCLSVHDSLYFPKSLRGEIENSLNNQMNSLKLINYKY